MHTGKTPYEYEGRDWGDASKNQGCQRLLKKRSHSVVLGVRTSTYKFGGDKIQPIRGI